MPSLGTDPALLAAAVAAVGATPLSEAFYRSVDTYALRDYAVDPLDGSHAGRTGGRYNRPGSAPVAYLAGSMTLAAAECEQVAMVLGLATSRGNPRLTLTVAVEGALVIDLTNPVVLAQLGLRAGDLLAPTPVWQQHNRAGLATVPQQLGEAIRASRPDVDGIRYPSWFGALVAGRLPRLDNLMLFMDPDRPSEPRRPAVTVEVVDPRGFVSLLRTGASLG